MGLLFGNSIRLKPLTQVCRALSTMLDAGVDVRRAFELAAGKTSDSRARAAMMEIRERVKAGDDITSAMKAQGDRFPELVVDMVAVGEQTGAMPEVFRSLSEHYENLIRLRKEFIQQITWPALQFTAAVFVIALLIYILGWIAQTRPGAPSIDVLGLGLFGTKGAITWLLLVFGTAGGLFVGYRVIVSNMRGREFLHPLLMGIPVLGTCLQSMAIARFSWAFALTQQAGMSIKPSLIYSLKATSNGAFFRHSDRIWKEVKAGEDLSTALTGPAIFPDDYLQMVSVAETSGTVPEALDRLGPQFEDQARRSLSALVQALAWTIWGLVATFIVYVIFRIVFWYLSIIEEAMKGI